MPRFFCHFMRKREDPTLDAYGVELRDLAEAHRHAVKLAERTVRLTASRWERQGRVIQVTDGDRTVLTVLVPAELPQPTYHAVL